jgi:hypothetical protein
MNSLYYGDNFVDTWTWDDQAFGPIHDALSQHLSGQPFAPEANALSMVLVAAAVPQRQY